MLTIKTNLKKIFIILLVFISNQKIVFAKQDTRVYELKQLDQRLNIVYTKIIKKLDNENKKKLRGAQRQWIKFRDEDCRWAYNAEPLDCLIERTDNRIKQLEDTIFFDSKGNYSKIDEK